MLCQHLSLAGHTKLKKTKNTVQHCKPYLF